MRLGLEESMKRRVLDVCVVLVAVCLLALPSAASVQGSFERTLQVSGAVDLEVLTRSGDITVRSGPAGKVSIRGTIHVGDPWFMGSREAKVKEIEQNPPIRQSGNSIHIDYPNVRNVAIDYDITVPADTSVRTHSGSGDQTIEGLRSNFNLEAGSGDLRLTALNGDLRVRTGSGNVEASNTTGSFNAEAGSGDIRLEARESGDVRVHTGSGNIAVRGVKGSLNLQAGSGDITVEGVQTQAWEVRTGSGDVRLHLPHDAGFELNASTGSGRLVVDHPVSMTVQGNVQREHRLVSGKVRGGGPQLVVHTGSGDVEID